MCTGRNFPKIYYIANWLVESVLLEDPNSDTVMSVNGLCGAVGPMLMCRTGQKRRVKKASQRVRRCSRNEAQTGKLSNKCEKKYRKNQRIAENQVPPDPLHAYQRCNRDCGSLLGLWSHARSGQSCWSSGAKHIV